jgi:MFS family permease
MAIFFLQPIAFGAWLPRIPDVQQALGLGPAALALALLGLPVGTLLALPFAGRLAARIGAKATIFWGFPAFLVAVSLPALATSVPLLFVALMLVGSTISTLELGLNVKADQVERAAGRPIMNTCHGFWSFGIMAGSLVGVALAALRIPAFPAIGLTALAALPIALLTARALPEDPAPEAHHTERKGAKRLPGPALIAICLFVFGITMTEGAIADWSAVFLRSVFSAPPADAGIGYSVFALLVTAGRFGGDWLKSRYGPVMLARACGTLAIAGVAAVFIAPSTPLAIAGFGLIGFGVSVGFPLAVTAAASLSDRPAAASVAVLSFIALLGFLVGPPVIGTVAEHAGMRWGIAMLIPGLVVSLALTVALRPGSKKPAGAVATAG